MGDRPQSTVKPEFNDYPRDPKIVVFVDRWSLFGGNYVLYMWKTRHENRSRCRQMVVSSGLTVHTFLYALWRHYLTYLTLLWRIPSSSLLRTKGNRLETTIRDELGLTFSWVGDRGVPSNIVGAIFNLTDFRYWVSEKKENNWFFSSRWYVFPRWQTK